MHGADEKTQLYDSEKFQRQLFLKANRDFDDYVNICNLQFRN